MESITIPIGRKGPAELPPDWVFTIYRDLRPPVRFDLGTLSDRLGSSNLAKQFTHVARKHHWVVRIGRGDYVALDPSAAVRVSYLQGYWKALLAMSEALKVASADHAFVCLQAMENADYVPGRPMAVVAPDASALPDDAFVYRFGKSQRQTLDVDGWRTEVHLADRPDTALLFVATGLPREIAAAKTILDNVQVSKDLARRLNHFGIDRRDDVVESEDPKIGLPKWIRERRTSLAEELLRSRG